MTGELTKAQDIALQSFWRSNKDSTLYKVWAIAPERWFSEKQFVVYADPSISMPNSCNDIPNNIGSIVNSEDGVRGVWLPACGLVQFGDYPEEETYAWATPIEFWHSNFTFESNGED